METDKLLSTVLDALAEDVAKRAAHRADGGLAELRAQLKDLEETVEALDDDDVSPLRRRLDELEDALARIKEERDDLETRIVEAVRRELGRLGRSVMEAL